jgi:adenine-specific DNA-methyltransferase
MWYESKYSATTSGTMLLRKLLGKNSFSYPKSLYTVMDILKITTNKGDVVFDFFAGSGTTGHAVLELNKEDGGNRKFVLVEQLDEHMKVCTERISKVMKNISKEKNLINFDKENDFIYCELRQYNEVFMDKIQKAGTSKELENIWKDIAENSFLNWYVNPELPDEAVKDFEEIGKSENGLEKQKRLLAELLNKNQLYVNLTEIDDKQFNVSKEDKELNKAFYGQDF